MTLKTLFQMATGRERSLRRHALTQAAVLFAERADVGYFVRTGFLGDGGPAVMPYQPRVLETIQERMNGKR